jgi:homoaconitase
VFFFSLRRCYWTRAIDSIPLPSGGTFKFAPPFGAELPAAGFAAGESAYYPPAAPEPEPAVEVAIAPDSQRLERLAPFPSPFPSTRGMELPACRVLMRVRGKCTTDHISAAGPWLKYKGHLTNISENLRTLILFSLRMLV